MFQCPNCRAEYDSPQPQCSLCGAVMAVAAPGVPTTVAATADQRQRKLLIGIVVLLVLALVAVGGIWFAMFSGGDGEPPQALVTPTASPTPRDTVILSSISDKGVREALATLDKDKDGSLTLGERKDVKELTVSGASKVDKLGTMLPALTTLTVSGGTSQSVDVSDAPGLTSLNVESEPIESLDLSHNTALTDLHVNPNTVLTGMDKVQGLSEVWILDSIDYEDSSIKGSWNVTRDAAGRVTETVLHDEFRAEDGYSLTRDASGRVTSLVSYQAPETCSLSYDSAGRPTQAIVGGDPDMYGVDAAHYQDLYCPFDSVTYDAQGRVQHANYFVMDSDAFTFSYDGEGHLSSIVADTYHEAMVNGRIETHYTWSNGRLTDSVEWYIPNEPGTSNHYEYDADGRLVRSSLSSYFGDATKNMSYDAAGRISRIDAGSIALDVTYDKYGNYASLKRSDGMSMTPHYSRHLVPKGQEPEQGLAIELLPMYEWQRNGLRLVRVNSLAMLPNPLTTPDGLTPRY